MTMRLAANPAHWAALSPVPPVDGGRALLQMVCSTQRAQTSPAPRPKPWPATCAARAAAPKCCPALSHGEINARLGLDSDYTRAVEAFMGSLDAEVARHPQ